VQAAAQVERLIKRIREGRIEVTGMYFNFDEIPMSRFWRLHFGPPAGSGCRHPGLVAMQNDVNGIGWCLNDYFKGLG
jgi:hypothetical protein